MDILEGYLHRCPLCDKEFWARNEWVYQRRIGTKNVYFCTYTCWRKDEKDREAAKAAKKAQQAAPEEPIPVVEEKKITRRVVTVKKGRCAKCNAVVNPKDKFCHECGEKF